MKLFKNSRWKSIFRKMLVSFLIISVIPQVILVSLLYKYFEGVTEKEINVKFKNIASTTLLNVDRTLYNHFANIKSWSSVNIPKVGLYFNRPEGVRKYFNHLVTTYKIYDLIILADKNGRIFTINDVDSHNKRLAVEKFINQNISNKKWFVASKKGNANVSDWEKSDILSRIHGKDVFTVQFSAPIYSMDGSFAGVITSLIDWQSIQSTVDSIQSSYFGGDKKLGYGYLVKKNHDIIMAHPVHELYGKSIVSNMGLKTPSKYLKEDGNAVDYDFNGLKRTSICSNSSGFGDFQGLEWIACISASNEMLYSSVTRIKNTLVVVLIISIIGALLLSIRFSKKISDPIKKLRSKTNKVALGDYRVDTKIQTGDEIESLDNSLNEMVDKLVIYQQEAKRNAGLAAIGQTATQIAHDVRRPLAVIKSMLKLLPARKDDPKFIASMTQSVERSINSTNTMLSDVLEFSKDSQSLNLGNHNPQSIITSALGNVLGNSEAKDISVEYDLRHKNYLNVDGERIIRIFVNILGNAVDAMDGKGKLWIKTRDVEHEAKSEGHDVHASCLLPPASKSVLQIVIGNNGPEIPKDVQKKLFEPFYTHGKKGGTGLGLSICQKIVDMHGGIIRVSSLVVDRSNKIEFTIELPAVEGNLEVNEAELVHSSIEFKPFLEEEARRVNYSDAENTDTFMKIHKEKRRPMYLMLVDDEPLFRTTIRHTLSQLSQVKDHVKIVESDSAETALDLFKECEFDYVIADIDLGRLKMDGYEFAATILDLYKSTHVIIHSNKRKEELDKNIREIKSKRFLGFLPKPMSRQELLQFLACKTFEATKSPVLHRQVYNKKVLVVNDDPDVLMSMDLLLGSMGADVIQADSVNKASELLNKNNIDIILSDVNMGENQASGYDFLMEVRKTNTALPFYLVSGFSQATEAPKAKDLGANGYFQMPLEEEMLKSILQQ